MDASREPGNKTSRGNDEYTIRKVETKHVGASQRSRVAGVALFGSLHRLARVATRRKGRGCTAEKLRCGEAGGLGARSSFHRVDGSLFSRRHRVCAGLRKAGVGAMSLETVVSLVVCALLLIYLTYALLRPEKF